MTSPSLRRTPILRRPSLARLLLFAFLLAAALGLIAPFAPPARAHVGSPDLFYNGTVGPYPARITIRMPRVVPGRAEISVRLDTPAPAQVFFSPLYASTAKKNAPPPDVGRLVPGESNLYSGELWLMNFGAYSVEVRVQGAQGEGVVQIPVTSVATRQLPMPAWLGAVLAALGSVLVIGAVSIASAAVREAALARGQLPGPRERRLGLAAAVITLLLLTGALLGGHRWWQFEEGAFRRHLREGAWPDLLATTSPVQGQRLLHLELGKEAFPRNAPAPLIPDHGKLIHLFLIRQDTLDAFAHLHPVRKSGRLFDVAVPPLPAGRYTIFCDLTFEGGTSSTATTTVDLPAPALTADTSTSAATLSPDPDDSWGTCANPVPTAQDPTPTYRFPDGTTAVWKTGAPLRTGRDASLHFEFRDPTGQPLTLEPYMGMLSHAAVLRRDGTIFAHLHPSGNYSMAAQTFFATKFARESKSPADATSPTDPAPVDHEHMHHAAPESPISSIDLPYEFPEPGPYRLWVQFKSGDRVKTAVFDAEVAGPSGSK